jgi:hypothetical protein
MTQYIFNVGTFWSWSDIFCLTYWHTDVDYKNHIFYCAQYVVLAYITVHMLVHLIGQCLVLFDPNYLPLETTSLRYVAKVMEGAA